MEDIVIVAAARTPVGSFNGAFGTVPAHVLGSAAIAAAVTRAKLEPGDVDEVILGQVLPPAQGMNPARQAAARPAFPTPRPPSASTRSAAPASRGGAGRAADPHRRKRDRAWRAARRA